VAVARARARRVAGGSENGRKVMRLRKRFWLDEGIAKAVRKYERNEVVNGVVGRVVGRVWPRRAPETGFVI
jgi:hypothetical protein